MRRERLSAILSIVKCSLVTIAGKPYQGPGAVGEDERDSVVNLSGIFLNCFFKTLLERMVSEFKLVHKSRGRGTKSVGML